MNSLTVFEFNAQVVRVIDRGGEPWFVAKDLCNVLEIGNVSQALSRLDDDEKWNIPYDTIITLNDDPGTARLLAVSESGMYALVLTSRKAEAKPFRKWVTSEVLPAIRKQGSYSVTPVEPKLPFDKEVELEINALQSCFANAGIDPKLVSGVLLNHAGTRLPGIKAAVAEGHALLAASNPSELLLTPTKVGKELGISAKKVNMLLLELGYQTKNIGASKSEPDYLTTEAGKPYSNNTLATGKLYDNGADNTTYQHLKWKPSIVDVLRPHLSLVS